MEGHEKQNKDVSVWCLISMASIPLVMTLGNSMLIPVLPIFEEKVGISSFQSSMVITSYSVASIFLIPIAGYLSDRFGRKMVILPSLILALIGGLIAGYASWKMENPYTWIIIGRVLQGIGASGASPIILPLVGDLYKDDDEKTSSCLGIIETSNTFGKVLSPILGSLFAAFIWFLPFFSISFFSLISIVLVFFFIKVPKEKDEPKKFKDFWHDTKKIFKKEGKWLYTVFLIGVFVMLVLFGVLFFLSDNLEKIHDLHGIKKGLVIAIPLFFLCVSSYVAGKKIKGELPIMKKIIMISLAVLSISLVFVGFTKNRVVLLLVITSLVGIAIGALLPTLDAIITQNIEKEQRGTITSFYMSSRFIGVAAGPPVMSLVMKNHINMTYIISGIIGIGIVLIVMKFISSDKKEAAA
ncbi:MFS transporter [Peribacillus castrilensis]|jgi:ACDE family multidrug resistance protein|uniref:Multidrug resistance protein n=2 Tax=Peribacillus TaxID=2675229 RepID=A0AAN2PKI7_9BACI|nr:MULTISPECIES: MFS transporter [Bacillaceae]KOR80226.1 MFS transporter [Bacillus sp. FJAT-21352]KOR86090.1 MFS transporter [Bacillus sp. FJAT-22058]KRF54769.1 MFS transporter [Bacillus sp. Soil745]MCD1158909.1 MFS transporter [Peribacillus castrilensis]MCP1095154.1 MFS transporter [Bacillaceae bacterium OS4b]QYF84331.1 MFS transporter [Brevibacterium sp. PAMC21349]